MLFRSIIVNTGKGHADLSAEYSSIPNEMKAVARALGFEKLGDTDEDIFLSRIVSVRRELCNDRAIMRALHFYEECSRVKDAAGAIHEGDSHKVLQLMDLSGKSSWEWLQNCYVETNTKEEPIAYALALTALFLKKHDRGICRINGGGFAGVIMCIVPKEETHEYVDYMTPHFGNENIHVMGIRKTGAVHVI